MYTQVLPLHVSTKELVVNVALISIMPSTVMKVRVEPLMAKFPEGLVTVLPVLVNPP